LALTEYRSDQIKIIDLSSYRGVIGYVCQRPGMLAPESTFLAAATFIEGYVCGRSSESIQSRFIGHKGTEFGRFEAWLGQRCHVSHGMPKNRVWWFYIRELFPRDEEALKAVPALYDEFLVQEAADVGRGKGGSI
jgi:hypothetical protein